MQGVRTFENKNIRQEYIDMDTYLALLHDRMIPH